MSTHNICFHQEIRKILCGHPLLSLAMPFIITYQSMHLGGLVVNVPVFGGEFLGSNPAGGVIQLMIIRYFIAWSPPSPFHHLYVT